MAEKLAMVTGSFDPITLGHVEIIRRAAALFDNVSVVMALNVDKEYLFTKEQRLTLIRAAIEDIPNVQAEVCTGMVAPYAAARGAVAFVRGIRGAEDVAYEQVMAHNNVGFAGMETVLLFADEKYAEISSTKAREALLSGEGAERFLPPKVLVLARQFLQTRD